MAEEKELSNDDKELLKLFRKTLSDPKTRKEQLGLIKKVEPERAIAEYDAEERVMAAVKPLQEKLAKMEEERDRDKTIGGVVESRNRIKAKYNLDDEGVKKVEQVMIDKKIGDHDTAAQYFQFESSKLAAPTSSVPFESAVDLPTDKPLLEDPARWARNTAHTVMDEIIKARR